VDEAADAFALRLDPAPGHVFVMTGECSTPYYPSLVPGAYRVSARDDRTISLEWSETRVPGLVGKRVHAEVEIRGAERPRDATPVGRLLSWLHVH
jgi:hypothetical protein